VLIAGGGTGGHLFPGIAVADEMVRRFGAEVRFVGSTHGIERTAVPRAGYAVDLLSIRGVMGEGLRGLARAAWRVPESLFAAWSILGRFRPSLVIGVGGYAAFPALAVAAIRHRPIVLLEQNAIPGLVTRLFAPFARAVCVSFAETASRIGPRARLTGNPVRWKPRGVSAPSEGRLRVLVFGGSAGAHRLNEIVPGALSRLGGPVQVLHQTGAADHEAVTRRYRELGIEATVVPFVEDMRAAYEACDVAVCRAGATTLAELTAMGVPAILVPYPFAAADHQRTNAEALVRDGAAWLILDRELDEATLAARLEEARTDPAGLAERRRSALALGRADAIDRVVDVCLEAAKVPVTAKNVEREP